MTVVARRPGGPLAGLVTSITYRAGEQPRTSVEKIHGHVAALAVMEEVLVSFLAAPGPDPAVTAAAGALARGMAVGEAADRVGLLPRTLRRRFTAQVGLTPKRFARIQRLKRVVTDLDGQAEADWAAVAFRHGYSDQPHLAGEFRELAGVTPTAYLRSRVNGPSHVRFDVRA